MTKTMLQQEWSVSVEQAIEMEAQAQALCMGTQDFRRAFEAFAAKRPPCSRGTDVTRARARWPFR
jgi:enoyl-CoA hydratase/carnithine racemase